MNKKSQAAMEEKTRIEQQITYSIFYCNEDLNQLIAVE